MARGRRMISKEKQKTKIDNEIVSVIVPVFNIEAYLRKCLDSVVNQTYKHIEIILVDDGSSDGSAGICDEYAKKDNRIHVIHQANAGLVAARKIGLNYATGKYCMHVDGDDWISEDTIEILVNRICEGDYDFVQAGYIIEDSTPVSQLYESQIINQLDNKEKLFYLDRWLKEKPIIDSPIFIKLYKKAFFDLCYENVPKECSYGEDYLAFIYILYYARKVAVLGDFTLAHYRVRNDSMSHKRSDMEMILKDDSLTYRLYGLIKELFGDISEKALEDWVIKRKKVNMRFLLQRNGGNMQIYSFPDVELIRGKRVVIYGGGLVGRDVLEQLAKYEDVKIVAWIDKNPMKYSYSFRKLLLPETLNNIGFDFIIIAVWKEEVAKQIEEECEEKYHIPKSKMLWAFERKRNKSGEMM